MASSDKDENQKLYDILLKYGLTRFDPSFEQNQIVSIKRFEVCCKVDLPPRRDYNKESMNVDTSDLMDVLKIITRSGYSFFTRSKPFDFFKEDYSFKFSQTSVTYDDSIRVTVQFATTKSGNVTMKGFMKSMTKTLNGILIRDVLEAECIFSTRPFTRINLTDNSSRDLIESSLTAATSSASVQVIGQVSEGIHDNIEIISNPKRVEKTRGTVIMNTETPSEDSDIIIIPISTPTANSKSVTSESCVTTVVRNNNNIPAENQTRKEVNRISQGKKQNMTTGRSRGTGNESSTTTVCDEGTVADGRAERGDSQISNETREKTVVSRKRMRVMNCGDGFTEPFGTNEFSVVNVIDKHACSEPSRVFARILRSSGVKGRFELHDVRKLPFKQVKIMYGFKVFEEDDIKMLNEKIGEGFDWRNSFSEEVMGGAHWFFWRKISVEEVVNAFAMNLLHGIDNSIRMPYSICDVVEEDIRKLLRQKPDAGKILVKKLKEKMFHSTAKHFEKML
ncbi:hypothetical protein GCK72_000645 [Caenorhabditis remanei]|uniref:Uncharacterized protein n=1 Tax=Caenorhabditis remanei TaxID=31234 RepID=A0A6A5HST2_CAERE|nr:hypothetical protein GCK72_000645 [Caenorhabditis remanei]KAF1768832.1 hypothetical protein GCK72_000645 [Caenorhabditis remanei]